ncbi:MAG: ABC transporter ATP-binding protein [Pseudomonadota bacterium]|nr:ABC transporter ATP-binding protein [Pseudomonadota bacterium]
MNRIHGVNVAGAAVALILLGQIAVYWPARHAASISPAAAVRGAQFRESTGSYRLDGKDVKALNDNQRSHIRNRQIGFVFQGFNLIPNLNIYDNVDAPLHYRRMPAAERRKRVIDSLEKVGLTSRMHHFPAQLSGGQQQRAAIARAIGGEPLVILADEPTGNLDTTMSSQIMDLLQSINASGTTILMVTHNNELAQRAHRQVHMVDGQIATDSPIGSAERIYANHPGQTLT